MVSSAIAPKIFTITTAAKTFTHKKNVRIFTRTAAKISTMFDKIFTKMTVRILHKISVAETFTNISYQICKSKQGFRMTYSYFFEAVNITYKNAGSFLCFEADQNQLYVDC